MPTERQRLTITEAADKIGVSTWTIRRRISDGTLPATRLRNGRAIRLDLADVEALLRPIPATGGGQVA